MGGGDKIPQSLLESVDSVSADVDSFIESIINENTNDTEQNTDNNILSNVDEDFDDDDDNDARSHLPAGAGSPLALALAATDDIHTKQNISPTIYEDSTVNEQTNIDTDNDNDDDDAARNLMSFLNASSANQDDMNDNNKHSMMAEVLGGNEIAQMLLQDHLRAEEVLKQMELDRKASEELSALINGDGDTDVSDTVIGDTINDQNHEDDVTAEQNQNNNDEVGDDNEKRLKMKKEENEKTIAFPEPAHDPLNQSINLNTAQSDESSSSSSSSAAAAAAAETTAVSSTSTSTTTKKQTMERGEIIIDFVWENERRGRWLSVLAVRASGGNREDSNCWVKANEKNRKWFESPRQSLVDSFTANNGPVGNRVYKDEAEQLRKSRCSSDRKSSCDEGGMLGQDDDDDDDDDEDECVLCEDGKYWTWLSPWQVDNSDTFGVDRLSATKEPVINPMTSEAAEWLYADEWPTKSPGGIEYGYYAESKGSLWTKVRCRRWVRPRERVIMTDMDVPPFNKKVKKTSSKASSVKKKTQDNSKPEDKNSDGSGQAKEQEKTIVKDDNNNNDDELEGSFLRVSTASDGGGGGSEAAGVRCKVCGMVLPMDTDEVEYHMEQGCGGTDNGEVGDNSGGGEVFGNERRGLRNRIRGLSFLNSNKDNIDSSSSSAPEAPQSGSIQTSSDDSNEVNSSNELASSSRFSFFSRTKNTPSSPCSSSVSSSSTSTTTSPSSSSSSSSSSTILAADNINAMGGAEVDIAALLLEEHKKAEQLLEQMAVDRDEGEDDECQEAVVMD